MKRYYYKDPLAAAWMAKHFKMLLTGYRVDVVGLLLRQACWKYIGNGEWGGQSFEGFTVHPDSLHLLEPKVGDIVLNCDDDPARVVPTGKPQFGHYETPLRHAIEFVASGAAHIIQRDGKPFFWPESAE